MMRGTRVELFQPVAGGVDHVVADGCLVRVNDTGHVISLVAETTGVPYAIVRLEASGRLCTLPLEMLREASLPEGIAPQADSLARIAEDLAREGEERARRLLGEAQPQVVVCLGVDGPVRHPGFGWWWRGTPLAILGLMHRCANSASEEMR